MIARRLFFVALAANVLSLAVPTSNAQPFGSPTVPVHGQVISRNVNGPASGLTVFLVHQAMGRSTPSFTDANGRFGWVAIPVSGPPYFLELYWGQQLIYRQPIRVAGPTILPTIVLSAYGMVAIGPGAPPAPMPAPGTRIAGCTPVAATAAYLALRAATLGCMGNPGGNMRGPDGNILNGRCFQGSWIGAVTFIGSAGNGPANIAPRA